MANVKKTVKKVVENERRRRQEERPSLFERDPSQVNRSAPRMVPPPRKGTRGARERSDIQTHY